MKSLKLSIRLLMFGLLFMTACNEDLILEEKTELLPKGMFPVEFAPLQEGGASHTSSSRITEERNGVSCTWTKGDQICVSLTGGGNSDVGTCTLDENGNITNTSLFWQTKEDATVSGWYPTQKGEISMADQRYNLVYVMRATPVVCNYQSGPVPLVFNHQLAKIRIVLSRRASWMNFGNLTFHGYTSIHNNNGVFSAGKEIGYLVMKETRSRQTFYEIAIYPMEIPIGDPVLKYKFSRYEKIYKAKQIRKFEAGKMYTFHIDGNSFQ